MTTTATWRQIHDGSQLTYWTLAEDIRQNGYRHMRRAAEHAAAGRFDYADGSAIKASRNFAKAIEWVELFGEL